MSSTSTGRDRDTGSAGTPRGEALVPEQVSPGSGAAGFDSALLERLIASAPHAIAVTEGPSHVLRRVNPAFCRLMAVQAERVLGQPYGHVFYEPAGEGAPALLERVRRSGEAVQDHEVARPRAADESAVWSYTVWPLHGDAGRIAGLVVEVWDRTHEAEATRRLQEMADQIRQINERLLSAALREQELAEQAEAGARAKAGFLSMMSHELRTPLSGIVGYTEVLLGGMLGPTNARQRDSLERINLCSGHLLKLIDDVLSYAQTEAQRVEVRAERVDLNALAREVASIIEPLTTQKGLDLRVQVSEGPLPVETDPHKVRQILLNLMGNAVKFTDRGWVWLEVHEDPDEVRLGVRDTGIGIPPEDLERIFEPFVQGDAVLTRRFGGTGLGLPISRQLALLLGGELTAESNRGGGSTFTVRLPRTTPHRSAASSP